MNTKMLREHLRFARIRLNQAKWMREKIQMARVSAAEANDRACSALFHAEIAADRADEIEQEAENIVSALKDAIARNKASKITTR